MDKGLIHVYTGNGKGKTSSAIGLAVRAVAHGLKVCYIYFHKDTDKWGYAEHKILKKLGVVLFGFAKTHPFCDKKTSLDKIRKECLKGFELVKKIYRKGKYDILILDEMLISVRDKFITEEELIQLLNDKPKDLELVLTGRGATKKIIEMAGLVSGIKNIKHPYNNGVKQRKGIEY